VLRAAATPTLLPPLLSGFGFLALRDALLLARSEEEGRNDDARSGRHRSRRAGGRRREAGCVLRSSLCLVDKIDIIDLIRLNLKHHLIFLK
jgi:hypothetical protein